MWLSESRQAPIDEDLLEGLVLACLDKGPMPRRLAALEGMRRNAESRPKLVDRIRLG